MKAHKPFSVYLLLILIFFQSISAIGGGAVLALFPSGRIIKMPLDMLKYSPFPDFLIPGLFLLIVLGIGPLVAFIGLIKEFHFNLAEKINLYRDQHWSHTFSYYIGIILILWIDIEVTFLRSVGLLHLIYALLGVAIVVCAQMPKVRAYYQKENR